MCGLAFRLLVNPGVARFAGTIGLISGVPATSPSWVSFRKKWKDKVRACDHCRWLWGAH
jgi:hypothetical protein